MKLKFLTSAAIAAIGMAIVNANAQVIPVTNGSFESPTTAFYTLIAQGSVGTISGWTFDSGNAADAAGIILASVNDSRGYGGVGVTGSQIAFLNIQKADPDSSSITSDPITTIAANTNYLASVAVGNDPGTGNFNDPGNVTLNLLANSAAAPSVFTVAATEALNTSTIPDNDFENFTISLSAAQATLLAGDSLEIQMVAYDPTAATTLQPVFDDVTLTASVPEPKTWAFLAGGLFLLVAIQRSRRMT